MIDARMGTAREAVPAYAMALDVRDTLAVVVGGGGVAERKVRALLDAGARVRVVCLRAGAALTALGDSGAIDVQLRVATAADFQGARLAFAATDDDAVNAQVVALARAAGVLVNDAGDSSRGDFATPLVERNGPITFAIDTGGLSPSFAIRLRDELRERFDERYARAAVALGRIRTYVTTVVPAGLRAETMREFATREIDALAILDPIRAEHEVEAFVEEKLRDASENAPGAAAPPPELPGALVCATRASALAMWQTKHVMAQLAKHGMASTVLPISTQGDRVQDRSLAALGTDSIFVKELELALRDGRADYAVHSCKDLPSALPDDMTIAAFGEREDPRDAFCSERYPSLAALPAGAVVGTSSPRRRAQLQALRPDLTFAIIRGNVDTRLRKLREGDYDAIVLAAAGMRRLGLGATYTVPFEPDELVPAIAQGALAIEVRADAAGLAARLAATLNVPSTELTVRAERAFLRAIRGGCQAPVGAHATFAAGELVLRASIAAVDGSQIVRGEERAVVPTAIPASGVLDAALVALVERTGDRLARRLLAEGGADLLGRADEMLPLAAHRFLLPRTQDRPSRIAPALRDAGADVVEVADGAAASACFAGGAPDALLFPSSGAVAAVAPYLAQLHAAGVRPLVAAMGEASAAAATAAGFTPDVVAAEPTTAAFVQSITHQILARERP